MIPRADKQLGLFFHLACVFFDNHTLSSQVDYGAHVQKVAGQDDIEYPATSLTQSNAEGNSGDRPQEDIASAKYPWRSRPGSIRPTLVATDNQFPESPVGLGVQATITDCGGHWIRS